MSDNVIFIGSKPIMNYVLAVLGALNRVDVDKIVLKARGQAISRAVDVAEVARRQFLTEMKPCKIEIGTEQMPISEGSGTRGVSTISIEMEKPSSVETEKTHDIEKEKPRESDSKKPSSAKHKDLSELKGVGEARAEKLQNAGFKTIESLAKTSAEKLSSKTGLSEKVSGSIIEAAKNFLKNS